MNRQDLVALSRSHGIGLSSAKALLEQADGDLARARRLAEAEARDAALRTEGGDAAAWAEREQHIRQTIRDAESLQALRRAWNKDLLEPLLKLPRGPELDALVEGVCQEVERAVPGFERPAPKAWHAMFLHGVADVRLGLFRSLSLKASRSVLEASLGMLAHTGQALQELRINLLPGSAQALAEMDLPMLRAAHFQAPLGDLSAVSSARWFSQLHTLGLTMVGNSGQGQHPDAKELLNTRALKAALAKAPGLRVLRIRGFEVGELDLSGTQLLEVHFSSCVVQEPDFPNSLERLICWRCVLGHFVFPAAAMVQPKRVELTLCGELGEGGLVTDAGLAKETVDLDGQRFQSTTLALGELAAVLHVMEPPSWAR